MTKKYYAHSIPGRPPEEWQPLEEHLTNVGKLAAEFACPFGGEVWSKLVGDYHDIGKGTLSWQAYLRHANNVVDGFNQHYTGRVEHSVLSARLLYERTKEVGKILAYCISGHHGGLQNWDDFQGRALKERLAKRMAQIETPFHVSE